MTRSFLSLPVALWVLSVVVLPSSVLAARPNILFLFADDQRRDTIAAYGNEFIETPHLDALASRGYSFRQNYCMGSIHGAVCQPSRAMLMSGRTLYRVPMNLEGVKTLPELLRDNGYTTFGTGKWHNQAPSFLRSFELGTAAFMGGMSDHTKVPISDIAPDGSTLINRREGEKFSSELFADSIVSFLENQQHDKPFFAYAAFTAPHDPRQPPAEYREKYYRNPPPLPPNFMPQHPFHNGWMVGRDENLAAWPRTSVVVQEQLCEYYGLISHLDSQVGRILDVLTETGLAENTLIVYAADHGLAVGSHGLLGKQSLYEHSMGCPLIIAGQGIPAGKSSQALTYLYDLYPTICDLVGIDPPESVEGTSLKPVWQGEVDRVRETLFTTYEDMMRAVRDDRWKLIRYPKINYTQLFDLQNDPHELTNLAGEPDQANRVAVMMQRLAEWQQKTDDTQPLTSDKPESSQIDLTDRAREPDRWQPEWIVAKYYNPESRTDAAIQLDSRLFEASPLTVEGSFTGGIEGPACDAKGNIFAVNFAREQTIGRVTPSGKTELFVTLPNKSTGNGIRFDRQGMMYVADYMEHNVLRIDPTTRKISVFAHEPKMNQPNDLAIGQDGTLWASDPAWGEQTGQLWRIDSNGDVTQVAHDMGTTNGIEVSPDGRTLYVNESVQRNIWAFTITPERTLSDQRLLKRFPDFGFDGMRCDVDGNLYITRHGKGTVVKLSPSGDILAEVAVLGSKPSNICFGGPDGRTAYVTEMENGRLVQFRTDRPGLAWQRWQDSE